ncbi:MAG: hypothetical protein HYX32_08210 [Actinobacteria bacterium]|nr:hypothetical protein [Actinomycetota bacterium]
MTNTTSTDPSTTSTTITGNGGTEPATTDVVTSLLDELVGGTGVSAALFTHTATMDATVPHWRFPTHGSQRIAGQLTAWFTFEAPARFDELRRLPTPTGEVVHLSIEWTEHGVPHAAHQSLTIDLDAGRIAAIALWCGGRWPAPLLAEIGAANMAADR